MQLSNYTHSRANKLAKLSIADITEPFYIKVLWIQQLSYENGKKNISTKPHEHSFFEVHFILSGSITYTTDAGKVYTVRSGNALLFAPGMTHTVTNISEDLTKLALTFMPDADSFLYRGLARHGAFHFQVSAETEAALDAILAEADQKSAFSLTIIKNRILDIICSISRLAGVQEDSDAALSEKDDVRIARVKQYIKDNKGTLFTCAEVAEQCHFNAKYLNRIFKMQTGMTLLEYIHRTKVKDAEALLTDTKHSLEEISRMLGFANVYYFSSFFKRCTGITPGIYRKLGKK